MTRHRTNVMGMAILMLSAFLVRSAWEPATLADVVFSDGVPLEDLADPATPGGPIRDLNLPHIPPGQLRDFLIEEKAGPRAVAKRIFAAVAEARRGCPEFRGTSVAAVDR